MMKEQFSAETFEIKKHSISILAANLYAFLYSLPFLLLFLVMYVAAAFIKGWKWYETSRSAITENSLLLMLCYIVLFLILIIVHEFLHAVFFLPGCDNRWKSIKFGIKSLTPYCHCEEIISVSQYRKSLFAPIWFICLPLAVAASLTGDILLIFLAFSLIVGSGGDLYIAYVLRKYNGKATYVYDLVDEVGCQTYVARSVSIKAESEKEMS